MENLIIRDFKEFEDSMTEEQKILSEQLFRKFHPEGTSVIMCVSENPERDYLDLVDSDLFS